MDIGLVTCIHPSPEGEVGGKSVSQIDGGVEFSAPQELKAAGFPHSEARFPFDNVHEGPTADQLYSTYLKGLGKKVLDRQNCVIYFGGKRATPKRDLIFGPGSSPEKGVLHRMLKDLSGHPEFGNHIYKVKCFLLGKDKVIVDLFRPENDSGVMTESLKGPPVISGVTEEEVDAWGKMEKLVALAATNQRKLFEKVQNMPGRDEPFPVYMPDNIIFSVRVFPLHKDTTELEDGTFEAQHEDREQNSFTMVALGDSERPALCGIEQQTLAQYEDQQKTLSAVVNVLGAIRCRRLRVPFGKCRLMHLLKRAYNAEKNNPHNETNEPTVSYVFLSVLGDGRNAEESYHTLTLAKRIVNVIGGSGVGPASRDLAVERWRLEQDVIELKDELEIVKTVHGYKPKIYKQAKPVANIKEEEQKEISKIMARKENEKKAEMEVMRTKAEQEAKAYIDGEQKKSSQNIAKLEALLGEKTARNQQLNEEHASKIKEHEKQLEKVRKKRKDEEEKTEKIRKTVAELEEEQQQREEQIAKQREQYEMLSRDHTRGTEMIIKDRKAAKEKRDAALVERREMRSKWLAEMKAANEKIIKAVTELDTLKRAKKEQLKIPEDKDADTEETIKEDVKSIDGLVRQFLSLDDETSGKEETRKQLIEYFTTERKRLEKKLSEEMARREQLELAAGDYKLRLNEQQNRVKKDQMSDAIKKERHLESLMEQVVQYLEHGCRMTKIRGTERKRYLFISEDRKRIHSCEVDEEGLPANKRRPTTTAYFKDIKRIILGQYTANFKSFEAGRASVPRVGDLIHDVDGAYNRTPTATVTSENMSTYFYRSFSLEFKKGKTWDVIAETDSDFEAWVVVLQRLLCQKDEWRKIVEVRKGVADPPPTMAWGEPLDISGRQGRERLMAEELKLCADNHITPIQYINIKAQIIHKAQLGFVTVYDVRTLSTLDLLRSRVVHDFFLAKKVIPQPNPSDIRA